MYYKVYCWHVMVERNNSGNNITRRTLLLHTYGTGWWRTHFRTHNILLYLFFVKKEFAFVNKLADGNMNKKMLIVQVTYFHDSLEYLRIQGAYGSV